MDNKCSSVLDIPPAYVRCMHRVEVLRSGNTNEFEFWTNPDGSVYLCREYGDDGWQAIIDGDVIVDHAGSWEDAGFTHPVVALTAPSVSALVPLIAIQERIHLLLDHQMIAAASQDPLTA